MLSRKWSDMYDSAWMKISVEMELLCPAMHTLWIGTHVVESHAFLQQNPTDVDWYFTKLKDSYIDAFSWIIQTCTAPYKGTNLGFGAVRLEEDRLFVSTLGTGVVFCAGKGWVGYHVPNDLGQLTGEKTTNNVKLIT